MGFAALSTGVSALSATQRALDVSAHNVANTSTQGFTPQQASFQEAAPAGSGVTLSIQGRALSGANPVAAAGTDLPKEISSQLVYRAQFDLSAQLIKAEDERLGSLIDIRA
ncbi:hypothetical protein HSX11_11435 [Oxalobacteraceae bacterium]|nr:hypothetical protein [Oxalobacteraceae bacterium]